MDRLDLSDLSGRTPAGERRWKLGTFLANSALSRRFFVCEDVLMDPDGSCEKNSTWIQKTQETYGNLIINFWLWIARPAMWWSQRPIQTSPATFACCWAPWMQSSPSWMPRERLRCLDRNIEHTWTYNFLIKDAKMLMKCVTFFLEISCLVSQRDMPRVVDIISFLSDAKLPRNATCPEHGWAAASQNALASIIRIS